MLNTSGNWPNHLKSCKEMDVQRANSSVEPGGFDGSGGILVHFFPLCRHEFMEETFKSMDKDSGGSGRLSSHELFPYLVRPSDS